MKPSFLRRARSPLIAVAILGAIAFSWVRFRLDRTPEAQDIRIESPAPSILSGVPESGATGATRRAPPVPKGSESWIWVGDSPQELQPYQGNGTLSYRDICDPQSPLISIAIHNGQWAWSSIHTASSRLVIDHMLLDERLALPLTNLIHDPDSPRPSVEAIWKPTLLLNVLDANTLDPLQEVMVHYSPELSPALSETGHEINRRAALSAGRTPMAPHSHGEYRPSPQAENVVDGRPSPVTIDQVGATGTYWVGAHGFEWLRWPTKSFQSDTPHTIALRRTGRVNLFIENLDNVGQGSATVFNLYDSHENTAKPIQSWTIGELAQYELDALIPKNYRFELRRIYSNGASDILATEVVLVEANQTSNVSLSIPMGSPTLAGLSFILSFSHAPSAIAAVESLILESLESEKSLRMPLMPAGKNEHISQYSTLSASVLPGLYSVSVEGMPITWTLAAHEGSNNFSLEIEDYRRRYLEAVDESTGERIDLRVCSWRLVHCLSPQASQVSVKRSGLAIIPKEAPVPLDLPSGQIEFTLQSDSHGPVFTKVNVHPDLSTIRAELPSPLRVLVSLKADGQFIDVNEQWLMDIEILDLSNHPVRPRTLNIKRSPGKPSEASIWFHTAGRYTLAPKNSPGFPELTPMSVEVFPGQVQSVTFEESQ